MIKKILTFFLIILFFTSCSQKQAIENKSATIIFKTAKLKFYDKGFISRYSDHINLIIFNFGNIAFDLKIYKDKVCKGLFECVSHKEFNEKFLHKSYLDNFLYELFSKQNIYFKDKKNKVFIKVIYD